MIAIFVTALLGQVAGASAAEARAGSLQSTKASVPASPADLSLDGPKLDSAKRIADAVWPAGTLARMYAASADADAADAILPGLTAILEKNDPHFAERMSIMRRLFAAQMAPIAASREPFIRTALAEAYARRFDAATLQAAATFYATPAGRVIAGQTHSITLDPAVVRLMTPSLGDTMKIMATLSEKLKDATKHLPPPPQRAHRRPPAVKPKP